VTWHADGKMHITWGPEGEKLSPAEKDKYAATLLADAKASREQHDRADKALEGLPFVAVPIEQLTDIYERMLRLIKLGQTDLKQFTTEPDAVRKLRSEVFSLADFGAVFAGQWLPPHVQKAVRDKVKTLASRDGASTSEKQT